MPFFFLKKKKKKKNQKSNLAAFTETEFQGNNKNRVHQLKWNIWLKQ